MYVQNQAQRLGKEESKDLVKMSKHEKKYHTNQLNVTNDRQRAFRRRNIKTTTSKSLTKVKKNNKLHKIIMFHQENVN